MEKPSILVVDDEESIRLSLSILLKKEGFHVEEAASGEEALEKLRTNRYDIVISDIMMPELDGITLLKKIKELDRKIDVILITAYANLDRAIQSLRHGASDFIQKPYENQDIIRAVSKIMEDRKLEAAFETEKTLPFAFNASQKELLLRLFNDGVKDLEISLKEIAGDIKLEVEDLTVEDLKNFPAHVGGEGVPMMGAYVGIYGDLSGSFMMVFQVEDCISLVEFVIGEKVGTIDFNLPTERGSKTVMELGDILANSYLLGLRESTEMILKSTPPTFVHFTSGNIRSFMEVRTGKGTHYSILTPLRVSFVTDTARTLVGYLISIFGLRSMRLLSEKIV
jgi:CheY-like chemotaxis protein/chemotaxis protein CheY-P-specific phosphatase CheC